MIIVISRKTDFAGSIFISSFVTAIRSVYWSFISPSLSFFPSPHPPFRRFSSLAIPLSCLSPSEFLFSMRDDKSWISYVLKTNRMKNISLHDDVSRVFSPTRGSEAASQDTFWNIRRYRSALSDLHPPDISKSLLLVLLKFKDAAHNFATSLSRTDRTKFIRHFLRDEEDNEKLRCSVCRIFSPDCNGREF